VRCRTGLDTPREEVPRALRAPDPYQLSYNSRAIRSDPVKAARRVVDEERICQEDEVRFRLKFPARQQAIG